MPATLTPEYIDQHMHSVHTPESWGRFLISSILNEAKKQAGNGDGSAVEIPVQFKVSTFEPKGCIQICGGTGGVSGCVHVNV